MFTCNICGKEFKNYQAVASHQSFHKVINDPCSVCGKMFTSQHALNGHMVWHNKAHRERIENINKKTTELHLKNESEYLLNPEKCKNCEIVIQYDDYIFKKSHISRKRCVNMFCSRTCSGVYFNAHKKHGYRRSKLEKEMERVITEKYPQFEVHYNRRDTILAELDIYIPYLKLAFEINGIFHYEPIYGEDQFNRIKTNDHRRMLACAEKEIELCLIDSSGLKSMKPTEVAKYLNIVTSVIDSKIKRLAL